MTEQEINTKLKELYLPPSDEFVFVDVPEMTFAMIDGEDNSDNELFKTSVKWLFSAIYPIKRTAKERMGRNFVEPPLEALWWADDMKDLIRGERDKLKWRLMIVMPEWITDDMFEGAVATARQTMPDAPDGLRLENFHEGRCVQTMHLGPFGEKSPTMIRLHEEFLPQHKMTAHGWHHQIYLNDPARVAPEKLKTVLRQPVRNCA